MSSSFDTMQYALSWLKEKASTAKDDDARTVLVYLQDLVDELHDADHEQRGVLNRRLLGTSSEELSHIRQITK